MRICTGIENLDEKIEGGIPQYTSILLFGPPGSGKTTFCNQFIYQGLKQNEAAIYVLFNALPEEIKESMKKFGWNIEGKIIIFLDAYSWQTGGTLRGKYIISNLADLNEFNIKISEAIKELQDKNLSRCCVDALSTLFLYTPADLAIKFTSLLIAKLKKAKVTSLIVLEKGVLDSKTVTTLESITDGTIEFGFDPSNPTQKLIRIVRMKDTKPFIRWSKLNITDRGIVVEGSFNENFGRK